MNNTPSSPPIKAVMKIWKTVMVYSPGTMKEVRKKAGIVKITPAASDSPEEPMVCTMLFSRIVPLRAPIFFNTPNIATDITATGMEALMVNPTRNPTAALAAANNIPKTLPMTAALMVNSAGEAL